MTVTAMRSGLVVCETCDLLARASGSGEDHPHCPRCGARLHARKPDSISRSWAFLVAGAILYIPANLLPVLQTDTLYTHRSDTILSGVKHLWVTGSWPLAAIVFIASMVVPIAKLISLSFLLVAAQRRSRWRPDQRARLHRATHLIGRWSMVDIYVGAALVALVQFKAFGTTLPGPGAIAFGAVVVLTMLASMSFDPRLTWDPLDDAHE